jgi:hypothetical protein
MYDARHLMRGSPTPCEPPLRSTTTSSRRRASRGAGAQERRRSDLEPGAAGTLAKQPRGAGGAQRRAVAARRSRRRAGHPRTGQSASRRTAVSRCLLDVNVLIALIDPAHVQHDQVHEWFGRTGRKSFATCPITENGLLRIVGHPKYPNSPGPPEHGCRRARGDSRIARARLLARQHQPRRQRPRRCGAAFEPRQGDGQLPARARPRQQGQARDDGSEVGSGDRGRRESRIGFAVRRR